MSEVASYHIMEVSSVDSIHTECKVVHKAKCIMWGPDTVQTIDQCVETDDSVAYVSLGEFIEKIWKSSIKLLIEISFGHLGK